MLEFWAMMCFFAICWINHRIYWLTVALYVCKGYSKDEANERKKEWDVIK